MLFSSNYFHDCLSVLLTVALMVFPTTNQAQETLVPNGHVAIHETEQIDTADIFVLVALIQVELELIRFEMGKPKTKQAEIVVKDAAPRELFFQALTLFRKSNRFSFEQLRQRVTEPVIPKKQIEPSQVYVVVDTALQRIRLVKKKLGIIEQAQKTAQNTTKTPSDVFVAIIQANRQLNLLLDQQFTPSDVFQQVTLAVGYTSRLLGQFPNASKTPPQTPEFERGKRPSDVYRLLIGCYELTRQIAVTSGLNMLILKSSESQIDTVTPSDVYDIASLVVSELAYLYAQMDEAQPPYDVYNPGRKLPSHAYQRAGVLEKQLIDLQKRVNNNPNWLKK